MSHLYGVFITKISCNPQCCLRKTELTRRELAAALGMRFRVVHYTMRARRAQVRNGPQRRKGGQKGAVSIRGNPYRDCEKDVYGVFVFGRKIEG